jgi:hypothetical protein
MTKNRIDNKGKEPVVVQGLNPGESLTGEMHMFEETLYFSFPVDVAQNDEKTFIQVNLTSVKGKYVVFARAGGLPTPEQGFWSSEDNCLLITPEDPEFVNKKEYTVGVRLLSHTKKLDHMEKYQFSVQYTFNNHHARLKSGTYNNGRFPLASLFFAIEISKDMDSVMILKNQSSVPYDLYLSIDPKIPFPDYKKSDFAVSDIQSGIHLNIEDLGRLRHKQKGDHALIYLTLQGKAGTEYGLTWNYNDLPLTINDAKA